MKLAIITVIIMSLGISFDVQAGKPDRHGARKSSPPKAAKSYKPRNYRKDTAVRRYSQQRPSRNTKAAPSQRTQRPNDYNSNNRQRSADRGKGFGSPKQSITTQKPYKQNNRNLNNSYRDKPARNIQKSPERNRQAIKPSKQPKDYSRINSERDNRRSALENRSERRITKPDRMTTREVPGARNNRDNLRPSDRARNNDRARVSTRLPESMPLRRHTDNAKGNINRHNQGHKTPYRQNKRDDFRYKQHRWLVNKQKHRRHTVNMPRQLHRYRNNHYRGKHYYGNWHRGHNHYHYDYRYRYLYNPYQWYDDYYYHAYLNWRWYSPSHWHMSGYYNHYMDPYYCPDDFGEFIATLAVGALILSW